jgi:hypothetical protein
MSCLLKTNWERPLVGQIMWGNEAGLDKDLRTLITTTDASIWAYVLKNTTKNQSSLHEVIQDFKNTEYRESLSKLKIFMIPNDFDADKEDQRETVGGYLKNLIVDDLLFNVVFGKLTEHDFKYFINGISGKVGLKLAILSNIAVNGLDNIVLISQKLGVSKNSIREKTLQLQALGFTKDPGFVTKMSLKGRTLLLIVKRIIEEYENGHFSLQLRDILSRIGQNISIVSKGNVEQLLTDDLKKLIEEYYISIKFSGFTLNESQFQIIDS